MAEVKRAMVRENSSRYPRTRPAPLDADSDADSGKDSDRDKQASKPQPSHTTRNRVPSSRGFINFSSAKQRHKNQIAAAKSSKRGDLLFNMIRLDIATFDLFDLPPIRYEAFMKTFGTNNTMQVHILIFLKRKKSIR